MSRDRELTIWTLPLSSATTSLSFPVFTQPAERMKRIKERKKLGRLPLLRKPTCQVMWQNPEGPQQVASVDLDRMSGNVLLLSFRGVPSWNSPVPKRIATKQSVRLLMFYFDMKRQGSIYMSMGIRAKFLA